MAPRLLSLLLLLFATPALAAAASEQPNTRVELIAESAAPAPGQPLAVGIVMTPRPGWHTYWKNPGDAGIETQAKWTLPQGMTAGPLRYPTPETYVVSGLMNHVYSSRNVLLSTLGVAADARPGAALPLRVRLDWLVCDDKVCVPEGADLALDLRVGDGAPDPAQAAGFAAARAALPKPVDWPARFERSGREFRLAVPFAQAARVRSAHFFASEEGVVDYAARQRLDRGAEELRLTTVAASGAPPAAVSGVLRVEIEGEAQPLGFALTARPGPVGAAPPADAAAPAIGWLAAIGGALLGGLLLNVMPCVFPILSLKALSLARAGETPGAARREGLAYTAGVILACTLLGALILALRAAGAEIGWAFQLQDPRVIALVMLLMLAIGLNFAGLFEIRAGAIGGERLAAQGGSAGAFWTGVLAAFVATPCTGPFLGLALGAAVLLPPLVGLSIFAALGLGLALPFLALGFVPALRRRLPRPGPWMERFRRILAVPMLATAVALAWVLGRQAGVTGMTLGLAAATALGLALWWLGLRQRGGAGGLAPTAAAALAALAVLTVQPAAATAPAATTASLAFSEQGLAELRSAQTPVFLYFTADWCITCKVNERGALSSTDVRAAFERAGVKVMVGDWTRSDPSITAFLERQGRSGIPLYIYYAPGAEGETLPQLLTVDRLLALVA